MALPLKAEASLWCAWLSRAALTVVVVGVSQVVLQAVNGALAVDSGLGAEADEGKHGQAAVLDLLQGSLLAPHVEGIEGEGEQEAGLQHKGEGLLNTR